MTSSTFFFIFIPILSLLLLSINLLLAPHNPYQEKDSAFECGFNSFLNQNRTQFSISFFIFALLFLIFDIEVTVMYPFCVSSYHNDLYGLMVMLFFFLILTAGFVFELGKNALSIDSKQTSLASTNDPSIQDSFISLHSRSMLPYIIYFNPLFRADLYILWYMVKTTIKNNYKIIILSMIILLIVLFTILSDPVQCSSPDLSSFFDQLKVENETSLSNLSDGDNNPEESQPFVRVKRCRYCLERGITAWVIPGRSCPNCGNIVS